MLLFVYSEGRMRGEGVHLSTAVGTRLFSSYSQEDQKDRPRSLLDHEQELVLDGITGPPFENSTRPAEQFQ